MPSIDKKINGKRVPDDVIIESYTRLQNIWKVGKEVGICGQSVHERVKRLGIGNSQNILNDADRQTIILEYEYYASTGQLNLLANKLKRTKNIICRYAKELGITNLNREKHNFNGFVSSAGVPKWKYKPHPRGMLGKKHTVETLEILSVESKRINKEINESGRRRSISSKIIKTRVERYGSAAPRRHKVSWKQGWRKVAGRDIYFRSRWEANYARYLEEMKKNKRIVEWEYESDAFYFEKEITGSIMFLPDFKVTLPESQQQYHEVKGWFDERSVETLARMKLYYPTITLIVVSAEWFKKYSREYSKTIEGWEI